jgi:import inner membrane translocase subunit TIM10
MHVLTTMIKYRPRPSLPARAPARPKLQIFSAPGPRDIIARTHQTTLHQRQHPHLHINSPPHNSPIGSNRIPPLHPIHTTTNQTTPPPPYTMSFLFGGRPQLSSEQKIAQAEAEIDMVSDMYSRYVFPSPTTPMRAGRCTPSSTATATTHRQQTDGHATDAPRSLLKSCSAKCIDASYREADLNKGESVCLDRCVSKFFEVNVKVSEKMQGEAQGKQGAGMFGGGM